MTVHTYKQFVHDTPVYVKLTQARPNYLHRLEGHTATMHSVCVREDICRKKVPRTAARNTQCFNASEINFSDCMYKPIQVPVPGTALMERRLALSAQLVTGIYYTMEQ